MWADGRPGPTRIPSRAHGSGTFEARPRGRIAALLGADTGNICHRRCGSFPASGLDRQVARNPRRYGPEAATSCGHDAVAWR